MGAHSSLGASGAERWMACSGSVALIRMLDLEPTDDPEYRSLGTAAHAAAAWLISHEQDAWEIMGEKFGDPGQEREVDEDMATAIQVHKDFCLAILHDGNKHGNPLPRGQNYFLESPVDFKHLHPEGYGTVDFGHVGRVAVEGFDHVTQKPMTIAGPALVLDVVDYKHGEGIYVEVQENLQEMYYAFALLQRFPPEMQRGMRVRLHIVQPRITWADPIRSWETTAEHIIEWATTVLIPAMNRTELDHGLDVGEHCRFCPAKLICPALTGLFKAACLADPFAVVNTSDEQLSLSYSQVQGVKSYIKALEEEVFNRLDKGGELEHAKLVNKKANRVWGQGAEAMFRERFGQDAYTKPELKTPPEMEKLGPAAKELVKEFAFTPKTGLTVALRDDPRVAVKVQKFADTYAGVVQQEESQ
jgi:uncharacterized protein DUF2800